MSRKFKALSIPDDYKPIKHYAMSLTALPANKMATGMENLRKFAFELAGMNCENCPAVYSFIQYVESHWLPMKNWISTYDRTDTTNNVCELAHRWLKDALGAHSSIYDFLGMFSNFVFINIQNRRKRKNSFT